MKKSFHDSTIYENLASSKFSGDGFLGEDKRSIEEIINSDQGTLQKLGIELDNLASRLDEIFEKTSAALGATVEIKPGITAVSYESMGKIPSPFKGEGLFEKGEIVINDTETNTQFILTRLGIHLIKKHGFFQGKGSRYRIDPEVAVKMLL